MPTSNLQIAPGVLHQLWETRRLLELNLIRDFAERPFSVLDVGPGRGKYGYLIPEYVDPAAEVDAIEAHEPYIKQFGLERIYREVIAGDVLEAEASWLNSYDAVLMVDVIEHMEKGPALELLERITVSMTIATPRDFFENPAHLPATEAHRSHWSVDDFRATGRLETHAKLEETTMGVVLVRLKAKR